MRQAVQKTAVINSYKDTVFRKLFCGKRELLSLYNALNGTNYEDPEALEIVTLDNAVYLSMKNDLAFLMNFQLYLYEHQSTYNPNMPLRFLQYAAREYEKIVQGHLIYSGRLLHIPAPHFIVFYNGIPEQPEQKVLRLSDAYWTKEPEPQLELKVLVLNINYGNNMQILEQCRALKEYMQYVERVRKHASVMDIQKAIPLAVEECIREGILEEFLRKNKAEVIAMSIFEYDEEKVMAAIQDTGRELGLEEGMIQSKQECILKILERKGAVSAVLRERIVKEQNREVLGEWFDRALEADSAEQFAGLLFKEP